MPFCKIVSGTQHEYYVYDGAAFVLLYTLNPTTNTVTYANKPAFIANKNATNQTSMTSWNYVKITFGTEVYDVGGFYASSTWTPPPGKGLLTAMVTWTNANAVDNEPMEVTVYENGTIHLANQQNRPGTTSSFGFQSGFQVDANGTDTFEIYGRKNGAGDGTISGVNVYTWLSGVSI